MKLSVTSWSFPACTLPEVAGIAKALGIPAVDVGYFYASALDKTALLADPDGTAARLAEQGVTSPCLYHLFGDTLADRNLADPRLARAQPSRLREGGRLLPRRRHPDRLRPSRRLQPRPGPRGGATRVATSLQALVQVAEDAGVQLTVEPHVHAYLESPGLALQLLEQVPGLKLTLDYAHFVCLGYRQEDVDVLAPHAAHVHLRQARPGALQAKGHEGTINMEAVLGTLRDAGYAGWLALEYVHQDYMGTLHDDVLTETVRLRDRVRAWLAAG